MFSRRFFMFLSVIASAYGESFLTRLWAATNPRPRFDLSHIWDAFEHHQDFVALGRICIATIPGYRRLDRDQIARRLEKQLRRTINAPAETLKQAVRTRIAHDFEREDLVTIDGWLLSTTEVLLAVLTFRSIGRSEKLG